VIFLEKFSLVAVIIAGGAGMLMLTLGNWRRSLLAFAVQYLAVFWLCSLSLSIGISAIKLITGVMAAILLAGVPSEGEETTERASQPGWAFRLLAGLLVWIVMIFLEPAMAAVIPGSPSIRLGGMALIGMGFVQLGISSRPGRVVLGLLTFLAGFEILYSALEKSVLVMGLLAVVTLGLAFTGSFLLTAKELGETP